MRELGAMMRKELLHTWRDPRLMGYVVGLPVTLLLLFGYALRLRVDDLTVATLDQDRTFFSLQVKDELQQRGDLNVVEVDSRETIEGMLRRGEAQLGLTIPTGFSKRVADNEQSTFDLMVDGTMLTVAQAALCGARLLLESDETAERLTLDEPDRATRPSPIKVNNVVLYNPDLRDSDFFLPGTLGIVVMLVCLTLSTTGFVREKEQQTSEQLAATPMSKFALVAGKIIPYGLIAAADFAVVALLARLVFALPYRGDPLSIVLLAVLFILATLTLGALISTMVQTQLQATFVVVFVFVVSLCLSGFIFPLQAIPPPLRPVSLLLPMTYFIEAIRSLTLKGTSVVETWRDFVALATFTVAFATLSMALFRKQMA